MLFSKSFGYAVRSVLYIGSVRAEKQYVQLEEITSKLNLPRQFTGRLLKTMVKERILTSFKGPTGGFSITEENLQIPLIKLAEIADGNRLENCVIKKKKCDPSNLCPLHNHFSKIREDLSIIMSRTTIGEFVKKNDPDFVRNLSEINGKNYKNQKD
jgi:Rrf2 family transcriptional regulator, iron-sulfur cluster assembly transcription factor